jgi:TonB family protein
MTDPVPHFLAEDEEAEVSSKLRETFLVSMVLHIAAIVFVVSNPAIFTSTPRPIVLVEPEKQNVTPLYQPPPRQPRLTAPPPPSAARLPEPSQRAEAQPERILPPVQPRLPRMEGSPESEVVPKSRRGAGEQGDDTLAKGMPPIGIPEFPKPPEEPPKRQPSLESVQPPKNVPAPDQAQLRLPRLATPSRGTDAILQEMARQHAEGGGRAGGGLPSVDPGDPDFNLPGPQILSDTMGVNFDPYLLRVYLIVRRNWYSVIPEIARLGRQGRVVLEFSIQRNGNVPDVLLVSGSGTESMDSAAHASIRLSNPFPQLPAEYPGGEIRLRFGYFYNMRPPNF